MTFLMNDNRPREAAATIVPPNVPSEEQPARALCDTTIHS